MMKFYQFVIGSLFLVLPISTNATAGDLSIHDAVSFALAENIAGAVEEGIPRETALEPFPEDIIRKVGWAKRFKITTRDGEIIQSTTIPEIGFDEVAKITISKRTRAAKYSGSISALTLLLASMIMLTGISDGDTVIDIPPEVMFLSIGASALAGGIVGSFFPIWETVYIAGRR